MDCQQRWGIQPLTFGVFSRLGIGFVFFEYGNEEGLKNGCPKMPTHNALGASPRGGER